MIYAVLSSAGGCKCVRAAGHNAANRQLRRKIFAGGTTKYAYRPLKLSMSGSVGHITKTTLSTCPYLVADGLASARGSDPAGQKGMTVGVPGRA